MENYFAGQYAVDLAEAAIASVVAGENMLAIGEPGCGKTDILIDVGERIAGDNFLSFFIDESTPPEEIKCRVDPSALLKSPPEYVVNYEGTVFDPKARVLLLDEVSRGSDTTFNILLHALDRKKVERKNKPVFLNTANFMPTGPRYLALLDRIALWVWVKPSASPKDVVLAQLNARKRQKLTVPIEMPRWSQIIEARTAELPENTKLAIAELCEEFTQRAVATVNPRTGKNFAINNRRLTQWQNILANVSIINYGSAEFTSPHPKAMQAIRWSFPCSSYDEHVEWTKIVDSVTDVIGHAIAVLKASIFEAMMETNRENLPDKDKAVKLGLILARAESEFAALPCNNDDPRIVKAMDELKTAFADIVASQ